MLEIAVIADDLTGAADTGVQFLPLGRPIYLTDPQELGRLQFPQPPVGLSLHTGSRHLPAPQAARVAAQAARSLSPWAPRRVYKKVDSCLRGPLGAEAEAVRQALDLEVAFIAPAFPAQGRTTREGIHLLHGVPVDQTEMGRDPATPVHDAHLARLMAAQSRRAAGQVPLATLEAGPQALAQAVDRHLAAGRRLICFDATEPAHLKAIASLSLERFPRALLVGSAGLALALVGRLAPGSAGLEMPRLEGPLLYVCGSASGVLRGQLAALAASPQAPANLSLDPARLADPAGPPESLAREAAQRLASGDLALTLPPPAGGGPAADALVAGLGRLAARVAQLARPAGLFLCGGDTALAVRAQLPSAPWEILGEAGAGLVASRLGGTLIVTKSGGFGGPEALVELARSLSAQGA